MAKADNVSVLERHLEKLALVVCLVLLALAVHHWTLSSPVSLKVVAPSGRGKQAGVSPEQVDEILQRASQAVRRAYDTAPGSVPPVPKWAGNTLDLRKIAAPAREVIDVALARRPIKVDAAGPIGPSIPRLAQLEKLMPVPPKPVVVARVELPRKAEGKLADVLVARGMAAYPIGELQQVWQARLKEARAGADFVKVVARNVIVEAQEASPDGTWSNPVRVALTVAPGPDGNAVTVPDVPEFKGDNVQAVRTARDALATSTWQQQILGPAYYPIWSAARGGWDDWRASLPMAAPAQGQVALWFHDEATMKLGKTYRYRMRITFVNPLLTYDEVVGKTHVEDARQRYVNTAFSEWSDPVTVQREVYFFLAGASPTTHQVTVSVFARKWGQTVMQNFRVLPGQPIGGKEVVSMPDPMAKAGEKRSVEVDFSTGAVSLRFVFNKTMVRRGIKVRTAEMLYLDADGKLRSSVQALDDKNELRKKLLDQAKQTTGRG